jgi:hypothetical protein
MRAYTKCNHSASATKSALDFKRLFWAGLALVFGAGSGLVTFLLLGWLWVWIVVAVYFCVFGAFVGGLCIAATEGDS